MDSKPHGGARRNPEAFNLLHLHTHDEVLHPDLGDLAHFRIQLGTAALESGFEKDL